MANDLEIRIGAELTEIKGALAAISKDVAAFGQATGRAGQQAAQGMDAATRAAQKEQAAAQQLVAELRHQAAAYGLARSQVLQLNKERDLAKIKTDAERKAVSAAYDELIRKTRLAEREQSKLIGQTAGFNSLTAAVASFVSVYSAISALRGISNLTDDYARLQAQLKLTTGSQEEMAVAQRETLRIAQETRAPLLDTANTYAALQRSTESLNPSQEQLVRVLETVNKSIALTPVTADTARASLTQFGQALAGDFKNGAQELNSILEQTPGLARAIADGMGVPVSALKKLGEEGKLSADIVFNALLRISEDIDQKFTEIPITVGGALTQLSNDVLISLGTADMTPLIDGIGQLRDILTDPAVQQGLLTLAEGLVTVAGAAVEATAEVANFAKWIGEELSARINGPAAGDLVRTSERIKELRGEIARLNELNATNAGGDPRYTEFRTKRIAELSAELRNLEQTYADVQAAEERANVPTGENPEQRTARLRQEAEARMAAAKAANEQAAADEKAKKAAEQRQKQIEQTLAGLQEEAATYGKTTAETVAYKLAVMGASQAEIDRGIALGEAIDALKAKKEAEEDAAKAAKEAGELEKKLAADLVDVQIRTLEASGQAVAATRLRLQTQFSELFAGLQKTGNEAGIKLVQGLIDTEVTRAQFDEIKRQFDKTVTDLQAQQESLANQVTIGALAPAVADEQQRAAREAAMAQLASLNAQMQALAQSTGDAGLVQAADAATAALQRLQVEGLTGLDAAVVDLRASWAQLQRTFAASAVDAGVNAVTSFFTDLASGTMTAEEALKNFVRNFAASMAQIAARALATYAVLQLLEAIAPGAGKLLGLTASVQHSGGMAGTGPRRMVNPLLFLSAPRMHEGGMVGIKPDERPTILQTGEEVLSRSDPRNAANGGQGSSTRIVNVVDPSMAGEFIESASGERAILNVISRNAGAVRQTLR